MGGDGSGNISADVRAERKRVKGSTPFEIAATGSEQRAANAPSTPEPRPDANTVAPSTWGALLEQFLRATRGSDGAHGTVQTAREKAMHDRPDFEGALFVVEHEAEPARFLRLRFFVRPFLDPG